MQSKIRLDAFPNVLLTGTVRSVSEYPLPALSSYSTIKEYGAEVTIDDPPPGVRSGMTAQVAIEVEKKDNVLQVPVQAVLERSKRFFCIVDSGGELVAKEVQVGSSNEQYVVISEGLEEGEQVVLAPQSYENKVLLPDVATKEESSHPVPGKPVKVADNSRTP
jgi:HlyD family secretion protein